MTANEDNNEYIINVREYSISKAEEWFKIEYENRMEWEKLYKDGEGENRDSWVLKDEYNDIFWATVDEIEEELLKFAKCQEEEDQIS